MEETGIVAGFHQVVNRRYPVDVAELDGTREAGRLLRAAGVRALGPPGPVVPRAVHAAVAGRDFIASLIGHGCLARHPRLKVAIVEFFTD